MSFFLELSNLIKYIIDFILFHIFIINDKLHLVLNFIKIANTFKLLEHSREASSSPRSQIIDINNKNYSCYFLSHCQVHLVQKLAIMPYRADIIIPCCITQHQITILFYTIQLRTDCTACSKICSNFSCIISFILLQY